MVDPAPTDDRVLELRSEGQSFGAVAKTLGLDSPGAAHDAFHRALCRRPPTEQEMLRNQELARLDTLSRRLQAQPDLTSAKPAAQLRVLDRLRDQLIEGSPTQAAKRCRTTTRGMTARRLD